MAENDPVEKDTLEETAAVKVLVQVIAPQRMVEHRVLLEEV